MFSPFIFKSRYSKGPTRINLIFWRSIHESLNFDMQASNFTRNASTGIYRKIQRRNPLRSSILRLSGIFFLELIFRTRRRKIWCQIVCNYFQQGPIGRFRGKILFWPPWIFMFLRFFIVNISHRTRNT